jgi:hypothetical protein
MAERGGSGADSGSTRYGAPRYAIVSCRRIDPVVAEETGQPSERDHVPEPRQELEVGSGALIEDGNGVLTAIVFASEAAAGALPRGGAARVRTPDELGHRRETLGADEVIRHVTDGAQPTAQPGCHSVSQISVIRPSATW